VGAGLRGRLLLAFLSITAFAVLAAAGGIYTMLRVGEGLDTITRQRVPAAIVSLQVAVQAERIMAATPALLALRSQAELERVSTPLRGEVDRLSSFVGDLRDAQIAQEILVDLVNQVDSFRRNLDALIAHVSERLQLSAREAALLRKLSTINLNMQRLLRPALKLLDAKRSQLETAAAANAAGADIIAAARQMAEFLPQQRANAEALAINDGLLRVSSLDKASDIDVLVHPLRRSLESLRQLAAQIGAPLGTNLTSETEHLSALIDGPQSIPETQRSELLSLADAERLIEENRTLSNLLSQAVARAVADGTQEIEQANRDAAAVQRLGTGILLSVVALSLICSGLIVWLYVSRNLLGRLTGLSDSMLAIAGGNLKTRIPVGGNDEIAQMAEALKVFRDTAVEVEENNLRAVAEARQRLMEAIESISGR
jgi:phosphoglycerate-specific signal transduction histidine kinase